MLKKIVFAFLLICMLAVPGSAWHLSFEGHTNELSSQYYSYPELTPVAYNNNNVLQWWCVGNTKSIFLNISYTDYLSMTIIPVSGGSTGYFGIKLYDSENNVLIDTYGGGTGIDYAHTPFRLEFIETSSGAGIETYKDGVLIDSDSYTASGTPVRMEVIFGSSNLKVYVDDLSNEYGVVGSDYELRSTDTYQYYTLGFPVVSNSAWYAKIYDNNGNVVNNTGYLYSSTNTVDDSPLGHTYSIARANLTSGGTYSIRLFRYDSTLHTNTFYAEEIFYYDLPGNGSISLDKSEVTAGDQVRIYTHINPYESGYFVYFETSGVSGEKYTTRFDIPGNDGEEVNNITYATINENSITGNSIIYLITPGGEVADYEVIDITEAYSDIAAVSFDKTVYQANDTVKISYSGAPYGALLNLQLRSGSVGVSSIGWQVTGSGSQIYNLGSVAADNMVLTLKENGGSILANDNAEILAGNFYLSGRVYDAVSGSAVEGATVLVGGSSDVTDDGGNYGLNANAGRNSVTITCSGYQTYYGYAPVYDLLSTKNFWIVPTSVYSGSSVYGVITSSGIGIPLKGVRVVLSNSTDSFTDYTDERGYFAIEGISNGTYSIRVSLSNYDSQQKSITVSGNTYQSFRLVAEDGYEEEGADPDESSGNVPGEVDDTNYSAQPYGAYGRHPFDFNGDEEVSGEEWRYAFEHIIVLIGCFLFMGFIGIVGRGGRR